MCVSNFGRYGPVVRRQDAADECAAVAREAATSNVDPLGYYGYPYDGLGLVFPSVPFDGVVVEPQGVSVVGGVVRGLVHNQSRNLFARYVVVVAPLDAGGGVWRWPLTVQPGERAPFEIAGWTGSADPAGAAAALAVTASLSPYVDISRSLDVDGRPLYSNDDSSDSFWAWVELVAPSSHPSLESMVTSQVIEGPVAYAAFRDDNERVVDVVRLTPAEITFTDELEPIEEPVTSIGGDYFDDFELVFKRTEYDFHIWAGAANPPPEQPPVLEPTDPPPRTPVAPLPGD